MLRAGPDRWLEPRAGNDGRIVFLVANDADADEGLVVGRDFAVAANGPLVLAVGIGRGEDGAGCAEFGKRDVLVEEQGGLREHFAAESCCPGN